MLPPLLRLPTSLPQPLVPPLPPDRAGAPQRRRSDPERPRSSSEGRGRSPPRGLPGFVIHPLVRRRDAGRDRACRRTDPDARCRAGRFRGSGRRLPPTRAAPGLSWMPLVLRPALRLRFPAAGRFQPAPLSRAPASPPAFVRSPREEFPIARAEQPAARSRRGAASPRSILADDLGCGNGRRLRPRWT